jgi:hypothetical protein
VLPPSRLPRFVRRSSRPLFCDLLDEAGVVAHRHDLGAVAHDARVAHEALPIVLRLEGELGRLEMQKRRFKAVPFRIDHAPGKARAKHPPGHLGEDAIVAELGEPLQVGLFGHQLVQRLGAALAFLGAGTNGLEGGHADTGV